MRTENGHGSGDTNTSQRLDRHFQTTLNLSSNHRVKRSESGKSRSRKKKKAKRKLALAAKLRLEPKSVKTRNEYFGVVKRRKQTKGERKRKHGRKQNRKDKTQQESGGSESTIPIVSRTQHGKTATEKTAADSNDAPKRTEPKNNVIKPVKKGLMLAGVKHQIQI